MFRLREIVVVLTHSDEPRTSTARAMWVRGSPIRADYFQASVLCKRGTSWGDPSNATAYVARGGHLVISGTSRGRPSNATANAACGGHFVISGYHRSTFLLGDCAGELLTRALSIGSPLALGDPLGFRGKYRGALLVGDAGCRPLIEADRQAAVRLPGCELTLAPGMDHPPPLGEPDLVLRVVKSTLSRTDW